MRKNHIIFLSLLIFKFDISWFYSTSLTTRPHFLILYLEITIKPLMLLTMKMIYSHKIFMSYFKLQVLNFSFLKLYVQSNNIIYKLRQRDTIYYKNHNKYLILIIIITTTIIPLIFFLTQTTLSDPYYMFDKVLARLLRNIS